MVHHLVLPGDNLLGGDVTHLQLAEVGEQLGADNMLLCGQVFSLSRVFISAVQSSTKLLKFISRSALVL